jgi:hypothetical protein
MSHNAQNYLIPPDVEARAQQCGCSVLRLTYPNRTPKGSILHVADVDYDAELHGGYTRLERLTVDPLPVPTETWEE